MVDLILNVVINCLCFFLGMLARRVYLNMVDRCRKKIKVEVDEDDSDRDSASNKDNKGESDYNFENSELKMVFLVREDLKLGAAKIASHVAQAGIELYEDITCGEDNYYQQALEHWNEYGAKKIVLRVENEQAFESAENKCREEKIPYARISQGGLTPNDPWRQTVLGIGPEKSDRLNSITGTFKLLR